MRILFVLDRVENAASANALMGFRLAEQLVACDHSVHILTLWDGLHTPPAPPEGVVQYLLAFADERLMNEALENGRRGGTPVPLRLARLAAHPTAAAAAFRQLVLKRPMCWASRRCCRGSAARKNTTICGAFSAAACTRNCGNRTLRRHCSAPCPAQT